MRSMCLLLSAPQSTPVFFSSSFLQFTTPRKERHAPLALTPYGPPLEQHITARWNRRSRKWNKKFQKMEQANLAPYHLSLLHFFSSSSPHPNSYTINHCENCTFSTPKLFFYWHHCSSGGAGIGSSGPICVTLPSSRSTRTSNHLSIPGRSINTVASRNSCSPVCVISVCACICLI